MALALVALTLAVASAWDVTSPRARPDAPFRGVDGRAAGSFAAAPELFPYNPVAAAGAVVTASDGSARFTVLTDRLIRMETIVGVNASSFEDRATLAMVNRNLPVPSFTHGEAGGVLTITTSAVKLSYTLGAGFTPTSLSVMGTGSGAFTKWTYGDAFPGNLLGTIRGQDGQAATPLNCTVNAGIDDNGEFNHCEWGLVSRDGWVVYDDTPNFCVDENFWWSEEGTRTCLASQPGIDAVNPTNSQAHPEGLTVSNEAGCCAACMADPSCVAGYVYDTVADSPNCWPLSALGGRKQASNRNLARTTNPASNVDAADLYGFFHGHDYFGALADFVLVGGKTSMVPRYASGVWNSRWFDYSSQDNLKLVDDYASRRIPLDVFVIDMDWHKKNDWSGFTFDGNLYPDAETAMAYLKALGMGITLNIHDASGVNNWEDMFPALISKLGLPSDSTKVPFNLVNATVAYAVEDIVLGDLVNNKHVDFMWIDWQQGGDAGGMTGGKQNPTFWLNHLRCTDRHRVGDNMRALVLARWGGLGMHRYQVGFSGDVASLTWSNMVYQPYFSATSANVGHGFWSHDIVGPPDDEEMYTRWIQIGSFSGIMRSHDRGGSAGGCNNNAPTPPAEWTPGCWIVEPWNVPNIHFEANRIALQLREELVPYIYTAHRAAFDTGVGLIIPMYYFAPEDDAAYGMDGKGNNVQHMFGRDILFSPVTTPAAPYSYGPGLATKATWLPQGSWYDTTTGSLLTAPAGGMTHAGTYSLAHVPLFYRAGAVLPFLPLASLPVLGLASQQYTFLGFKVVPGAASGTTSVYEDDGVTTAYITSPNSAIAWTTAAYTSTGTTTTVSISTAGSFSGLPATRAYQLRFLNSGVPASVTVNGVSVAYNRFGAVAAMGRVPAASAWYWEFAVQQGGMGAVINIVGASTAPGVTTSVVVTWSTGDVSAAIDGVYGIVSRAIYAKTNLDLDRSTPGSTGVEAAPLTVLASTGEALAVLAAGSNATGFIDALGAVPSLLSAAFDVVKVVKSPRASFSMQLLSGSW